MVSQCESKYSCKASGCNKRHHNLLHRETSTKNSAILTKIDENTQALNTGNAPPNTRSLPPNTANSELQEEVSITKISLTIPTM